MKSKLTLVHIFILNQIVMTLILLLAFGMYGTYLYFNEQRAVRERMEPALSKEVDRLNNDIFSLETNVQKLKSIVELFDFVPAHLRLEKFRNFAAATISPYATQYNSYFALAPDLAQKYFKKKAYIQVLHRDYNLVGTNKYDDPSSLIAQEFLDSKYLTDRDGEMQWWWMNEGRYGVNFSDFYFDRSYMEKVMFSTTTGIYENNKLRAVVGIDTLASDIAARLGDFKMGETGGLLVVDQHGRPIVPLIAQNLPLLGFKYSRASTKEEFLRPPQMAQKVFNIQGQLLWDFLGADGKTYLTYSKPIKGRPWHLVVYQEESEAYSTLYLRLVSLALVSFAIYVLLSAMVWITGGYVMNRDRVAVDELRESKNKAEAATRSKSLFLSTMSHEIRTPLSAILGCSELLEETPLNKEQKELLGSLKISGDTLLGMLNNVLDFSKFEFGRMQLERREFLLSDLIREVEALVAPSIMRRGLQFFFRGPEFDRWVTGDSLRLKQILMNLLGNAVKFTERGRIELSVEVLGGEKPGYENFQFAVKDTGVGVASENLDKIFEEFDQADSSVTRRFGGTGLGLSISRKLVRLMGGELLCESEEHKGSRFYFTVELSSRQGDSWRLRGTELVAPARPPGQAQVGLVRDCKILIVDDLEENHVLLKAYLKKKEHLTVDSAFNGYECLEKCNQNSYSLIFMDVQMPRISGLDAIRKLREQETATHRSRTPIVVISANTFVEDVDKSLQAGADEHCSKPIRKQTVIELIEKYCDKA
ncbi:MAG: response regulator [Bdellovibrio sp.]|nr:response regulator [Bdellovibrio sp.]